MNRQQISLLYHGVLVPFEFARKNSTVNRIEGGMYVSRWAILATNSFDVTAADLGLEGNLPPFLQCGAHIVVDSGTVILTFMAGGQLEWLSRMVALRPDSRAERVVIGARSAEPLNRDVAAALASRDFARPFFV